MSNQNTIGLPHVQVMILNYNGKKYLDVCISSLLQTNYPDFSIVVIDNNSSDSSLDLIKTAYPEVRLIENRENLGFGAAYDQAIRSAPCEYIALLNNDTRVDPDWLIHLIKAFLDENDLAAASARLLFMEHPRIVNHAGGGMNRIGLGYDHDMYEPDRPELSTRKDVLFPTGAACVLRKSIYQHVGGFDESFFMYHEDVDLGWRFWLYGFRVVCVQESHVYHAFGGAAHAEGKSFRNNLGYRHAIRSLCKNYQLKSLIRNLPLLLALGLRAGLRDKSINFTKCLFWNIFHLPSTLAQRRAVQRKRVPGDNHLLSLIWPHLQLPVYYPDYEMLALNDFQRLEVRSASVSMHANASKHLGYGWYAPDQLQHPRATYRWTRQEAVLFLWNSYERVLIYLKAVAMSGTLNRSREFSFYIDNTLIKSVCIDSDLPEHIELAYSGQQGPMELKIFCTDTWSPHALFGNHDYRQMGLGVLYAAATPQDADQRPYAGISLIIPTYNRAQCLSKVLYALEGQSLAKNRFEVIVVDDGSTDETPEVVQDFASNTNIQLKYIKQANKKQGAARNRGLQEADMPLVAFIGDDIIPDADFLNNHLHRHNIENVDDKLAVTGHTKWSPELNVTPFMEYIHEYGYQFGFSIMENTHDLDFNFFYTSNISLSRKFMLDQEKVFDEGFATYGWEDIELGFRLKEQGMRLCLEDGAVAFHKHPTDLPSFCLRQFNVGQSSRSFLAKHPELETLLGGADLERWVKWRGIAGLASRFVNMIDKIHVPLPHKVYQFILHTYYCIGATSATRKR